MDPEARRKWDTWAAAHPDLLLSVERGPDLGETRRIVDDLARKLELRPDDRLLDVGCGSGLVMALLSEKTGAKVAGVDFAHSQLVLGRQHFPDQPTATACAEQLPFADGAFSRILCYGVWHYVDDWRGALDDFLRVLGRPAVFVVGDLPSRRHRSRLYLQYVKRLAALVLHPRELFGKFKYSQDTSHWHWIDLKEVKDYLRGKGCDVEILPQPSDHRQYGGVTHVYRFDMKVRVG